MAEKLNIRKSLKDNTMVLILVGVMLLFEVLIQSFGKGSLFSPANITNIIRQNSYVVILATGMLLCILTGGNIDLSVGSVVALVGALAGMLLWRGVATIILDGKPIAPFPSNYSVLFESYLFRSADGFSLPTWTA